MARLEGPGAVRARARRVLLDAILVVSLSAIVLARSPWEASDLGMVPDAVEYAVAADRVVEFGTYDIEIEGRRYPPRYPPWFSILFLVPAYATGASIGWGIVPVTLFALAGVASAWRIGWRLSNAWGGAIAALGVTLLPPYLKTGRAILTDAPACALGLVAAEIYVRRPARTTSFLAAGLLIALAAALRSVRLALLLPFVIDACRATGRARTWRLALIGRNEILRVPRRT